MATLMLVDDEASIIEVYRNILDIKNHEVVAEASDGDEALLIYCTLETKPDVILMDHRMPRSNGITAMKNIQLINPLQCIIFVTADFEAAKYAMGQGAHSFIMKPFRMDALFNAIEVALADQIVKKNQIREAFLGLVARLNRESAHNVQELSDKLEKEVIDKFLPSASKDALTVETMTNWLCKFFNRMGLEFSYEISGNSVLLRNTHCVWMESLGPNPTFCLATRCVISRFAMKTGLEFNMDSTGSIMGGDAACGFEVHFTA
ncbi:MAG: response regulator [Candidatus Thermoplasmatota archaeon]|nr:response regulator [Euryarchaeota archaeon]MBU4031861.1 response regulator [Candidatus Thermoplasmatota archaeon]MBU4072366.1 response regulator [Candidatus Thermoplasmatota archaeon]MBU4143840.1 response regulator [Candidatus Thermoplasmatota archaeon]MBU4591907.1 response regulator [Candidatus Thermoplasmatota archaeon]